MISEDNWDIEPGQQIVRRELHDKLGGGRQGGISPSSRTPNILIFFDPKAGAKHGYLLDGWREDGAFHYTGEGQRGNQAFVRGNAALLDHEKTGRRLRLFKGARGRVEYIGEFRLDTDKPYYYSQAPETGGGTERTVIVFRLIPVGVIASDFISGSNARGSRVVERTNVERHSVEKFFVDLPARQSESEKRESLLVDEFQVFMRRRGVQGFARLKITHPGESAPLFSDLFMPELGLLIEAKGSVDRNSIRMAIGQLLDYSRDSMVKKLAILLPERPAEDLVDLLLRSGIDVICKDRDDFSHLVASSSWLLGGMSNNARGIINSEIRLNEELEDKYDALYQEYGAPHPGRDISMVRDAIEAAVDTIPPIRIRSDAKYFLLINFYQMICLPLRNRELPFDELEEMVRSDMVSIIDSAYRMSNGLEITGNNVLFSTARVLKSLKTSAANIWG